MKQSVQPHAKPAIGDEGSGEMIPETDDQDLRAAFDQSSAGICHADPSGRIVRVNDRYCTIVGHSREELLKLRLQDITHAEDLPRNRVLFERLLSDNESFVIEKRYVRSDGTSVWVQKNVSPVIGPLGTLVRVTALVVDISARKHAEDAAQESADRFRFMAESMPQKIFTANRNGDLDYLNQQWAEFTGLSLEDIKQGLTQFVHPEDREENIRVWQHSLETGESFLFEHRLRGGDGVYHWHLSRAHAMRDGSGQIAMWIGSSTDIDKVKRTEQALYDADRRKDEFLAMLGHELRNPLAPILTALQLMKMRGQAIGAEREREVIERQVRHVARLVDDLLDVSKITRGKISLQREPMEISVAIVKAVEIAGPVIERRTHQLCVDVPTEGLTVDGDPIRLTQVVANLLTNAALYTPHGGRIDLRAQREGTDVVLDVTDTGIGIGPELLPRVFDMFTQGERRIDRAEGGLGLGLGLVQSLVKLHGGSVTVESPGPDKGSRFTVRLPALDVAPTVTAPASVPPAVAASAQIGGGSRRILVVDDNVDAGETLADLLRALGH